MKNLYFKGIKIIVAAVCLLSVVAILSSTYINAEVISKYNTSGKNVTADFFSESNGKHINGHLMFSEIMFKDGPGASETSGPMGTIVLDVFDPQSGQSLWGYGEITLEEFDISNSLRDAHAVGTAIVELQNNYYYAPYSPYIPYGPYGPIAPIPSVFPVSPVIPVDPDGLIDPNRADPNDPNVPYPPYLPYPPYPPYSPYPPQIITEKIAIDVTWTSTGDFMTGHYSSKSSYGDMRMLSRYFGRFCDAESSGTIIGKTFKIDLDDSSYYPYYAPYPTIYPMSSIGKFRDGSMVISKP